MTGAVLQNLSCAIQGGAPAGGLATLILPRCVPMGAPSINMQRETNRVMPVSLLALLPDNVINNLIVNGKFDTDVLGWTIDSASWAWNAGQYIETLLAAGFFTQGMSIIKGIEYAVEFDVVNYDSGSSASGDLTVSLEGASGLDAPGGSAVTINDSNFPALAAGGSQSFRLYFPPIATGLVGAAELRFTHSGFAVGTGLGVGIDNVTLVPNNAWNLVYSDAGYDPLA